MFFFALAQNKSSRAADMVTVCCELRGEPGRFLYIYPQMLKMFMYLSMLSSAQCPLDLFISH